MSQRDNSKSLAMKQCPLCAFEATTIQLILSHLRVVHSSDPHFNVSCGINGCASTSKSFTGLYSHVYRHHPSIICKREGISSEESSSEAGRSCESDVVQQSESHEIYDESVGQLCGTGE